MEEEERGGHRFPPLPWVRYGTVRYDACASRSHSATVKSGAKEEGAAEPQPLWGAGGHLLSSLTYAKATKA